MIDVTCYSNDLVASEATAETPECAVLTARTLWDEAHNGIMGQRRALVFTIDGAVVRRLEVRP